MANLLDPLMQTLLGAGPQAGGQNTNTNQQQPGLSDNMLGLMGILSGLSGAIGGNTTGGRFAQFANQSIQNMMFDRFLQQMVSGSQQSGESPLV